ncbi:MAG: metallophosphoesterase family protein [Armatimonadota bacterium]
MKCGACLLVCLLCIVFFPVAVHAAVWGPVIDLPSPTTAQIAWRDDDVPAEGIRFNGKLLAGSTRDSYRLVTLSPLTPDTAYTYALVENGKEVTYNFRTPAVAGDFTFGIYGDCRTGHQIHGKIVSALLKHQPRFIINTGDIIENGETPAHWDSFFEIAAPLTGSIPFYTVPGNHERNVGYLFRLFPGFRNSGEKESEWYAVTSGNVQVIVLNSTRKMEEQRDWLEKRLAEQAGKWTWTIVAFHYPPYSSSSRNGDAKHRELWVPLLEKYRVDLVLLGHDHFYERSEKGGVTYIISGGGGAPLYPINASKNLYQKYAEKTNQYMLADVTATSLRLRMYRLDGTVGDEVTLKSEP